MFNTDALKRNTIGTRPGHWGVGGEMARVGMLGHSQVAFR